MNPEQALTKAGLDVPLLPDKLFFSIREVSDVCGVEPHVLRYWETEFKHIKPVKRTGNRRFYRHRDVYAVLQIKHLLYDLNFTIRGAKKRMQNGDLEDIVEQKDSLTTLTQIRQELKDILSLLD
ncbi:MAG: MerR family transcriptional regulator [Zetaproteobacteria bacterium CG12_big_fil_rev_8_21_14_0_65_54_13]|nr:MAG: MerR family transcriptional regulator [Zetaproteobacteria bacterium CG23_combo_of_CG06-09_8_20_14_all_54_7]PIW47902.1 MAG: MerR family transcriptional regulator [Zetaproteobacteria bacterium CG12_big_fil_rev_8_21_14_0_65_54_13]PIX53836.1 MAG: MerR family transcriptional regulator [Zetaproteobacteria bacterium CG_4_10_14_3_um_filter_54_28]PJA30822.1 MAG: MerR family transcriptional regulator [Zetaproteobacteria bacterium CG_4_9_14_3_um_filter_54_145]